MPAKHSSKLNQADLAATRIEELEMDISIYEEQVRNTTDINARNVYSLFIASKKKELQKWLQRVEAGNLNNASGKTSLVG